MVERVRSAGSVLTEGSSPGRDQILWATRPRSGAKAAKKHQNLPTDELTRYFAHENTNDPTVATWDDRATEPISTAILEEKKWVLRLYLIPSDDEGDEYKDEYRQTTAYIRAHLNKEFEETYNKGFASFEFDTDDDEDCITVGSPGAVW